jgi:hydroxymethylpyrimidine/phosphomethylpyrimidine kinase
VPPRSADLALPIPRVLSIAGSDSGGGAGIQADLKAFAASGVHGMTAITAITAQNTVGVTAIEQISPEMIEAQIRAVADDIGVDAVKVGMLGSTETIDAVAGALTRLRAQAPNLPVVVDPVMVSETGAALLDADARDALVGRILALATVLTPNLP